MVRSKAEFCSDGLVECSWPSNIEYLVGKDTALRERNRSSPTTGVEFSTQPRRSRAAARLFVFRVRISTRVLAKNSTRKESKPLENSAFDRTDNSAFENYTTQCGNSSYKNLLPILSHEVRLFWMQMFVEHNGFLIMKPDVLPPKAANLQSRQLHHTSTGPFGTGIC